jgi:hypothetical protein
MTSRKLARRREAGKGLLVARAVKAFNANIVKAQRRYRATCESADSVHGYGTEAYVDACRQAYADYLMECDAAILLYRKTTGDKTAYKGFRA